jgi:hypothetical protein
MDFGKPCQWGEVSFCNVAVRDIKVILRVHWRPCMDLLLEDPQLSGRVLEARTGLHGAKRVPGGGLFPHYCRNGNKHTKRQKGRNLGERSPSIFGHSGRREQDHNFLASRVNRNKIYIFGILTSRAIDWYMNESILRGPGRV